MKKSFLLLPLFAGLAYVTLTSSHSGGAYVSGVDGTKSTGGGGCGGGCHTSATSTTVALELDSAGVPVTHYIGGHSYTLKVTGTNTSTTTLSHFGFQVTVVKSAGAGTSSATFAGSFATTGLPTGVRYTSASAGCGIDVLEQNTAIAATTLGGATGGTYVMANLPWTAPAAGSGTLEIYGCVNAVNFNNSNSGDKYNNGSASITELVLPSEVASVTANMEINLFPNPAVADVTLQLNNAAEGTYHVHIYDMAGKLAGTTSITIAGNAQTGNINTSGWNAGIYNVVIEKDGLMKHAAIVKQ